MQEEKQKEHKVPHLALKFLFVGPPCRGEKGRSSYSAHPKVAGLRSVNSLHTLRISCSSLDSHQGEAKFCSAVHIQGSMLMRIIIKQCRVGTVSCNLLSSRSRKGKGRKSEKQLYCMLFWTWLVLVTSTPGKAKYNCKLHRRGTLLLMYLASF